MSSIDESPRSRLNLLFGEAAIDKLEQSCVMIFGVGGVGSNCTEALARGRVGRFILIDADKVAPSNINRQALAFHSTLGKVKVEAMRDLILDINPQAQVECIETFVTCDTIEPLIKAKLHEVDYVIDAIDTVSAKLKLAELSQTYKFPLISSMGGAHKIHPELFRFADIYETKGCKLSKVMRKEAKKRNIKQLRVLYSPEKRTSSLGDKLPAERALSLGTASFVPPVMGQLIAGFVIRELLGLE